MKTCEDCSMNTICTYYDKERKKDVGKCPGWRWFKRCWGICILIILLTLTGCVHVRQGEFEYWRFGNQEVSEALLTLPDGSELLLEGQKSELPKVEITATSIIIGGKKVGP